MLHHGYKSPEWLRSGNRSALSMARGAPGKLSKRFIRPANWSPHRQLGVRPDSGVYLAGQWGLSGRTVGIIWPDSWDYLVGQSAGYLYPCKVPEYQDVEAAGRLWPA